jgi:hypothetical protein
MRSALATLLLCLAVRGANAQQTPQRALQQRPQRDLPTWVRTLIAKLESEPSANPPARIVRYVYRGDTVYYLPPRCCDIPSTVFNNAGAVLCSADGGMTGRGDGRCSDFFESRREATIVWRDSRRR